MHCHITACWLTYALQAQQLDHEIGAIIDKIMTVSSADQIPALSHEAELVIAKPEFQDPSMHQQISDIQDHVRLHSDLKAILLEIEATAWGADGSALAALSQKAGALITPELEARPAVSSLSKVLVFVDILIPSSPARRHP